MSAPLLQYFCCPNNCVGLRGNASDRELAALTVGEKSFLSFNIICIVTSFAGILGAVWQLRARIGRCFGLVKTPDIALLLLVQNNIIGCLALADLFAAFGILVRSSAWLANILPQGNGHLVANVLCASLSAWIQYFFLCSYLWTLMLAVNMNYMSRDPVPRRCWMWLYHVLTWPLAAVICAMGLIPLYWPSLSTCVQQRTYLIPVYATSYVPLAAVMVATVGLYANSVSHVINTNITGYREMNDRDRSIACRVRDKFFSFLLVFYLCWLPNIVSAILLLLASFPVNTFVAIFQLMAVFNPLQGLLNCIAYRRVSVHWPQVPSSSEQFRPSTARNSGTVTTAAAAMGHAVENDESTLLIFGDT